MMKYLATLIVLPCIITVNAQVPNGGFESWTGNVPDDWSNNNIAPLNAYVVTPSNDSHSGAFSAQGEIISNPIDNSPYAPVLQNIGTAPVTTHPTAISGWFKFNPSNGNTVMTVSATTVDANGTPNGGFGITSINGAQTSYDMFSVPISASSGNPTAGVNIAVGMTDPNNDPSSIGSTFLVDDIAIDGAQSVIQEMDTDIPLVGRPYPSPFRDQTCFFVNIPDGTLDEVAIFSTSGQLVETLISNNSINGSICWTPGEEVPNGVYFIRTNYSGGSTSNRVLLNR